MVFGMISFYRRMLVSKRLRALTRFEKGCWIDAVSPDTVELEKLATTYELDMSLLVEALDLHELPRMDVYEKRTYIFLKVLGVNTQRLQTLLVVLGEDFVITLCREDLGLNLEMQRGEMLTSRKLSFLIELFLIQTEILDGAIHKVVKNVQKKRSDTGLLNEDDMEKLLEQEEFLNSVVSSFFYLNLLYIKIGKKLKFDEQDNIALDDLMVETTQSLNLAKESLKNISNLRTFYSVILTNRLNRNIKLLTIFTIFVTIPAAISGFYGMNIALPFQESPHAFGYVVGLVIIIWGLFLVFLKRFEVI